VGYEQVFIDVVRATGGNNAKRILIVQGPNTDVDMTYDLMNTLPTDATSKRLMVEVHYYSPWNFAGMTQDESYGKMFNYWGAANHVTGSSHNATWGEETYLKQQLTKMKTKFVDKDIPVIIGEYGANWKSVSGTGEKQSNHDASIKLYYQLINQYSAELGGMVPFAWDTNYIGHPCMTLINRSAKSIYVTPAMEGINAAVLAADIDVKKMAETNMDKDNVVACTYYDLQGRRLAKPTQGLYLARKTFLDGSVKTSMMAEE
jgi:aryl-phospho-beta-D-glucosidase BglC (GH1 family)